MLRAILVLGLVAVLAGCGGGGGATSAAPAAYDVTFATTKGDFVVHVQRAWAPHGADRFYELVRDGFYDGVKFFRVVPGFVVQFGISGDPKVSAKWQNATIPDDPVKAHNTKGTITFATSGPNSRTTQVFVNLGDNSQLDAQGFAPFGKITSGMSVVESLYSGYGDAPTPHQQEMSTQGDAYFAKAWPKLDSVKTATIAG